MWLCDSSEKNSIKCSEMKVFYLFALGVNIEKSNYVADSKSSTSYPSGCQRRGGYVSNIWDKRTVSVF